MKRQLFSFLLLVTFAVSLSAQKAEKASSLETNLRKHVEYLASDKLEGRRAGEPGAVAAGVYVEGQFRKIGLKPGVVVNGKSGFRQDFSYAPVRDPHSAPADPTAVATSPQAKNAFNVIGILPGHDPVLKNEAIVIGAHYDHLGHGGSGSLAANSTDIHHGADDNASGTAAIIELARMFAGEKSNKRTLIFIAFSGEEDGVFGSKYYVNNPVFPLEKTIAMINLDMVGRLNENKLTIGGIGTASEWKSLLDWHNVKPTTAAQDIVVKDRVLASLKSRGIDSVVVEVESGRITLRGWAPSAKYVDAIQVAAENSTSIHNQLIKGRAESVYDFQLSLNEDGFGPSDHSSFYGKQIPVLFFFTGTHLDYHKPSDTFEKINYEGLTNITNFVSSIAKSVDANPTRPTYAVAKSPNTGGRTTFSVSLGTIPSYADSTDGMAIDGVRENSPASKAGLRAGDKIIKLAGKDVKNVYDYTDALSGMKPDVEYEVVIKRGAETLTLKIVPAPAARR